jgi:hypothetical protein
MLELVHFATIKLVPSGRTQTTSSLLALFYCRFCFGYISASMGEALARNHMATLVAVREDEYAAQYHVEPILAEASARYTIRATHTGEIDVFAKVVDSVAMHIREDKMVEASVGDCGELAGAVALAAAMDSIRARGEYAARTHNMSRDVPLKVFLAALLGEDRLSRGLENHQTAAEFDNWAINFTNFTRLPELSDEIVRLAYASRTAFVLGECTSSSDILIVMKSIGGAYSYILVNVMNYTRNIDQIATSELLHNTSAEHCGLSRIKAFCNPPCCVSLLLTVGSGKPAETCTLLPPCKNAKDFPIGSMRLQATVVLERIRIPPGVARAISDLARPFRGLGEQPRFGSFSQAVRRAAASSMEAISETEMPNQEDAPTAAVRQQLEETLLCMHELKAV